MHSTDILINSGIITTNSSHYIGFNLSIPGVNINTSSSLYLADEQDINGVDIIGCNMYLVNALSTNVLDKVGDNDIQTPNSLVHTIINNTNTSNEDASIRRLESAAWIPNSEYASSDWRITPSNNLTGSAAGDPHITTFHGHHYEFDYLGAFRLFETLIDDNLIIKNGLSEKGPGIWGHRQYIRKLFIQNNSKTILFDMGYRGSLVKVLENNGFLYSEKTLEFNNEAKRYNFSKIRSIVDINEPVSDTIPALIRNEIKLSISNDNEDIFNVILQNVNQYNLQPCRISLNICKELPDSSTGCLVDIRYAPVSKLDNIKSLRRLEEPTLLDLQSLPELEIEPRLRNIQWE